MFDQINTQQRRNVHSQQRRQQKLSDPNGPMAQVPLGSKCPEGPIAPRANVFHCRDRPNPEEPVRPTTRHPPLWPVLPPPPPSRRPSRRPLKPLSNSPPADHHSYRPSRAHVPKGPRAHGPQTPSARASGVAEHPQNPSARASRGAKRPGTRGPITQLLPPFLPPPR